MVAMMATSQKSSKRASWQPFDCRPRGGRVAHPSPQRIKYLLLGADPLIIQSENRVRMIYEFEYISTSHVPTSGPARFSHPVGVDGNIHTNWLAKA
jgi:hypothetical protein